MRYLTYQYQEISARRRRSGKCPVCGKVRQRSTTITHTVNPFNKDKKGRVKTPEKVRRDVEKKADKWVPDFTCASHAKEN